MNLLMIELNMVQKEGRRRKEKKILLLLRTKSFRHNIMELIETEKEYVKDLALIVEVKQNSYFINT